MNGARSTFMRKGYLLTALAAAVLLAASPGIAQAQTTTGITVTGPTNNTVNEGGTATYTVTVRGYVGTATDTDSSGAIEASEAVNPAAFDVALGSPGVDSTNAATAGELADLNSNAHVLRVTFDPPSNSSTVNRVLFTQSKTISVATLHDNDAENESFTLAFGDVAAHAGLFVAATGDGTDATVSLTGATGAPTALTIDDDETQSYTLTARAGQTPTEGVDFHVDLAASPPHVNGSGDDAGEHRQADGLDARDRRRRRR